MRVGSDMLGPGGVDRKDVSEREDLGAEWMGRMGVGEIAAAMPDLRRYARSLAETADQADDLVQDCIVRALTKAALFQPGTNLRLWLFTVMHNLFINQKRRQQVVRRYAREIVETGFTVTSPIQIPRVFLAEAIAALARLSVEERLAMEVVGLNGLSHREAAARHNVPVGTMKSRLSRGRRKLRLRCQVDLRGTALLE